MIGAATLPGVYALPSGSVSGGGTDYSEIIVEGRELNRIVGGGQSLIELIEEDKTLLRIETEVDTLSETPEYGPHFRLAADLENMFSGRTLQVTVRARPSDKYGALAFKVNYSTGKNGESDWIEFPLSSSFKDYTFTYDVPERSQDPGVDFLAIRPVTPEKRRAIEIERVTFNRGELYTSQ